MNSTPTEAGFDGAKGIRLNIPAMPDGGVFRLRRGETDPRLHENGDYRRQLLWVMPKEEEPELWWCNDDNEWFLVSFEQISDKNFPDIWDYEEES